MIQHTIPELHKTAILVGTYRELTLKQIAYLRNRGYEVSLPGIKKPEYVDVFVFHLDTDHHLLTNDFVGSLEQYDVLIMSGGATANYILTKSGFNYISNFESYLPLVSLGRVAGGVLDGKFVILKGGLIGDESCYYDLLKWIGCLDE